MHEKLCLTIYEKIKKQVLIYPLPDGHDDIRLDPLIEIRLHLGVACINDSRFSMNYDNKKTLTTPTPHSSSTW